LLKAQAANISDISSEIVAEKQKRDELIQRFGVLRVEMEKIGDVVKFISKENEEMKKKEKVAEKGHAATKWGLERVLKEVEKIKEIEKVAAKVGAAAQAAAKKVAEEVEEMKKKEKLQAAIEEVAKEVEEMKKKEKEAARVRTQTHAATEKLVKDLREMKLKEIEAASGRAAARSRAEKAVIFLQNEVESLMRRTIPDIWMRFRAMEGEIIKSRKEQVERVERETEGYKEGVKIVNNHLEKHVSGYREKIVAVEKAIEADTLHLEIMGQKLGGASDRIDTLENIALDLTEKQHDMMLNTKRQLETLTELTGKSELRSRRQVDDRTEIEDLKSRFEILESQVADKRKEEDLVGTGRNST